MLKQILLAVVLISVPVLAFTGFEVYARPTTVADAGLGDLSAMKVIITDVQGLADKGDFAGAKARVTDFESAWDEAETAIRPLNPTDWGNIDQASDRALKAVRAATPDAAKIKKALAALLAELNDPSKVS